MKSRTFKGCEAHFLFQNSRKFQKNQLIILGEESSLLSRHRIKNREIRLRFGTKNPRNWKFVDEMIWQKIYDFWAKISISVDFSRFQKLNLTNEQPIKLQIFFDWTFFKALKFEVLEFLLSKELKIKFQTIFSDQNFEITKISPIFLAKNSHFSNF